MCYHYTIPARRRRKFSLHKRPCTACLFVFTTVRCREHSFAEIAAPITFENSHYLNTPKGECLNSGAGNGARTRHLRLGKAALYQMSYSRVFTFQSFPMWCGRRDLNSYALGHRNLNPARLPIPPRPHLLYGRAGDPSEIRTPDTLIKSQVLYRLS